MAGGHHLHQVYADANGSEYGEQTFMSGTSCRARGRLFVILGLLILTVLGAGWAYLDRTLASAVDEVAQARELSELAVKTERNLLGLQSTERAFLVDHDPSHVERYDADVAALSGALDLLSARRDSGTVGAHITGLHEGLAKHTGEFREIAAAVKILQASDAAEISALAARAARDLETRLAAAKVPALNTIMKKLRETERAVLAGGTRGEAARAHLKTQMNRFAKALAATPFPEKEKSAVGQLLIAYGSAIETAAKAQRIESRSAGVLDRILSRMRDHATAIVSFAEEKTVLATRKQQKLHELARVSVPAGAASALLLIILLGSVLMRTVTRPVQAIAAVTPRILAGDDSAGVPALGNHDEVGEIARTIARMRADLADTPRLRKDVEVAKAEVARQLEEADRLRRELTAREAQLEKAAQAPAPSPTPVAPQPEPTEPPSRLRKLWSGSISSMSETVALSSRDVSSAAFEAERTGTMIRGLNTAGEQLRSVEGLLTTVSEQTNFLTFKAELKEGPAGETNQNLIVLSSDYRGGGECPTTTEVDSSVEERLESIRESTTRATQTIREVAETMAEIKGAALDLATTTSEEALAITARLMDQSQQLRTMLDDLVVRIQDRDDESLNRDNHTPEKKPRGS